jgi:hypothetical protein
MKTNPDDLVTLRLTREKERERESASLEGEYKL